MDKGKNQGMKPLYFDYNATTPLMPEVLEAMLPYFTEQFGNAANTSCSLGRAASRAVEKAGIY
jgi:cysteine desulfurase